MDDKAFVSHLNDIARQNAFKLPLLGQNETPDGEFLADWAKFLELCVKKGISLADPRWEQLRVEGETSHTHFALSATGTMSRSDEDFRVGLQLLMGMLADKPDSDT